MRMDSHFNDDAVIFLAQCTLVQPYYVRYGESV